MRNRVREFRARHEYTQQGLANKTGVSRQTIIAIEKGRFHPSLSLAFKLSEALEAKLEELFCREQQERELRGYT